MKLRIKRTLVYLGVAMFAAHVAVLLTCGTRAPGPMWSNVLQFVLGVLASAFVTICAFEGDWFVRQIWRLFAAGFWLWTIAQGLFTLSEYFWHRELHSHDLLFLWPFAFLLAAALEPADDKEKIDGTLLLDIAQVLIIAFVLDLFLFEPDLGAALPIATNLDVLRWKARLIRNLVILGAIVLRGRLSTTAQAREIYWRVALVLAAYTFADGLYLYGEFTWNFDSGQPWDLLWSIPRLLALLVAGTWRQVPAHSQHRIYPRLRKRYLLLHTLPLFVPVVVLILAGALAHYSFSLMIFMVVSSMVCAGVRLLITQHKEMLATRELHSMNEQLAEWKTRYDEALIASGRVIYDWDVLTDSITYSSSLQQNFGLSPETVGNGHSAWIERIHPDDRSKYQDALSRSLATGERLDCEYRIRLGAPEYRTVNDVANVMKINLTGVCHLTGVLSDITEKRKLEQQVYASQRIESIGTLSGGIAHDFNNLITVMQGFCEMAEKRITDEQAKSDLKEVRGAATRAATLTRQLLAFSRRQVLQPQVVQVGRVVDELHNMLRRLIGEDIEFAIRIAPDVGNIYVDPAQLEQVIMNLVVNARDAMPRGGVLSIEASNTVFDKQSSQAHFGAPPGHYVELSVTDTGEGIPPELQSRIFEPFFTTKPVGQGTGLGLATVYGIVKQSQGYISCYSELGIGTTFKLYFPKSTRDSKKVPESPSRISVAPGAQTVLLAEDDWHVRQFTQKILTELGYKVLSADGAAMAQYMARRSSVPIEVLVTDLVMPGCSGQELAACIRAIHPKIQVLYISGYAESAHRGIFGPADSFLSKPFSGHALGIKLRELLATA